MNYIFGRGKMKIIDVVTKRGEKLYGCMYGKSSNNTCVIMTNGTGGNIFDNVFLRKLGEELEKQNITYIYAHNSGAWGLSTELFDNCLEDIQAFVDYAKSLNFKKIILGGHSYGANKVIYYLSKNKKEPIDKYILISPVDMRYYADYKQKSIDELLPIANKYKEDNRLDDMLPKKFNEFNYYTARAFFDFIENKNASNLPIYSSSGDFSQLQSIKKQGLYIMGSQDDYAFGDAKKHLQKIKDNAGNPKSKAIVIEGAGHTFKVGTNKFIQSIIDFVK